MKPSCSERGSFHNLCYFKSLFRAFLLTLASTPPLFPPAAPLPSTHTHNLQGCARPRQRRDGSRRPGAAAVLPPRKDDCRGHQGQDEERGSTHLCTAGVCVGCWWLCVVVRGLGVGGRVCLRQRVCASQRHNLQPASAQQTTNQPTTNSQTHTPPSYLSHTPSHLF